MIPKDNTADPEFDISSERNPLDWIFVLRPVLHPPVWTILILGYFASPVNPGSIFRLVSLMLISSASAGAAYIFNQIADIESDRINKKLHFLPLGLISKKSAGVYATLLAIIAIVGGNLISLTAGAIVVTSSILGYLYSGRPFYGKNKAVPGALLNGVGHGSLVFMLGYAGAGGNSSDAFLFSIPYFLAVMSVYAGTTLPDIKGDALSGKRTLAVVLGVGYTIVFMTMSLLIAMVLSLILHDTPMIIVCILCLPFYAFAAFAPNTRRGVFAARISVLFLSLAACVSFPWYLLLLSFLFVTSRLYYRKRFRLDYPSLSL